jgi:4-aminobutyrate aminotransferase-like enzyme
MHQSLGYSWMLSSHHNRTVEAGDWPWLICTAKRHDQAGLDVAGMHSREVLQEPALCQQSSLDRITQRTTQVLYMVNSGSEANDLALRIARAARPGATHVAVMGAAYHGHTGQVRHMISGKTGEGPHRDSVRHLGQ